MDKLKILGYSERGVLNSLLYEIRYSNDNLQLFNEFLSLIVFPYIGSARFQVNDTTILIEQSLSDFGDADLILALNNMGKKQVIFIEAKVKTSQRKSWSIRDESEDFKKGISEKKASSSNLFSQLYYKFMLIQALRKDNSSLEKGVDFPDCFQTNSKKKRKIGTNPVVLEAIKLLKQYSEDAYFVALVPENTENLETFFQNEFKGFKKSLETSLYAWDYNNYGYISWDKIEIFCKKHHLNNTSIVFEYNNGQIR